MKKELSGGKRQKKLMI